MITSRYLGSPPAPLRTRPLSSQGVLETYLTLYRQASDNA